MNHLLISLSTLFLLGACSTQKETKVPQPAPGVATVKPGAPTTLEFELGERSAKLQLRFDGAGENVSATISGVGGVSVTSPVEAFSGVSVRAGEVRPIEVAFTRSAPRGHLVVSVRGTFDGSTHARVHTVAVGDGPLPDDGSRRVVTDDGDAVKLMP
ncbi:MAG: hypothetical protein INH41_05505 [Myxococcaceae bacterium]|nr:hypothetical protein [Myxococcaceae bacterium]MCA3011841.1 hypothetical protein [Myxococcaceae bacterium]